MNGTASGAVYVQTNAVPNEVIAFRRTDDGTLERGSPTSHRRIVDFFSNILTLEEKTQRFAVVLEHNWVTYKRTGCCVFREKRRSSTSVRPSYRASP